MSEIKFCVCSLSKIKAEIADVVIKEVADFFKWKLINLPVSYVDCESGVNEQPIGTKEIVIGASNRIKSAKAKVEADVYIAIENGLIQHGDDWFDYGYVRIEYFTFLRLNPTIHIGISEKCKFPSEYVEITRNRGFATTTVGSVLEEYGIVADGKDPHKCLSGISRFEYLKPAAIKAANSLIQEFDK